MLEVNPGRIEYKYLVPESQVKQVRDYLLPYVDLDRYAAARPAKEYLVRSLYFDTLQYDFYYEKIEGLRKRKKLRIRAYNEYCDDNYGFLEIKRKNGPTISKSRSRVKLQFLPELLATGDVQQFLCTENGNGEDAKRFLFQVKRRGLVPTVLIDYEREAYLCKFNKNLRITFDKNLRSKINVSVDSLFEDRNLAPALSRYLILEIKTPADFPFWLNYLIASLELRQQALSKYTICLDSQQRKGLTLDGLARPFAKSAAVKISNEQEAA